MSLEFYGLHGELLDVFYADYSDSRTSADAMLHELDVPYGKNDLIADSELRHEATKRAILYNERAKTLQRADNPFGDECRALGNEMIRHFLTTEARYAEDASDIKFFDEALDLAMGANPDLVPTYSFVVPRAVELLDDVMGAGYLQKMLQAPEAQGWAPHVEWGALYALGGIDAVDEWSTHNADIAVMKSWHQRFKGRPIAATIDERLQVIDTMVQYPTLFNLPGISVEMLR